MASGPVTTTHPRVAPPPTLARQERKLKVAFYAPRATYLKPGESGDRVFVRGVINGLRERGHDVEIVSSTDVRDFWRGRLSARLLAREALAVRSAMRRFSPDAWIVFGTSAKYPDLLGWWQRPRRYVLLKADAGSEEGLPRRWRWLFRFAHRRSLARADVVGVERPRSALHLERRGVAVDRVVVLPLAAADWVVPSRTDARRRLGLADDAYVILCVSRLPGPRKDGQPWKTEGILAMLDAVATAELPAETVVVLGGDGPGRPRVEERIAEHGLGDRVRLLGSVQHPEVRWLFAACDVYAHYTIRDRMFTSIIEAQACGRPVVASRNPSSQVIVDEKRTGLLAGGVAEFAACLEALGSDHARRESMGTAAREYVEEHHSTRVRVRQIEALLGSQITPDAEAPTDGSDASEPTG